VLLYRREEVRRLALGLGGVAVGAALGLTYDIVQAHRLGETLNAFLRAGNSDFYLQQGRAARADAVLDAAWLGEGVRLLLLFGVLYAVGRAAGMRARLALAVAGPAAVLWSVIGPAIADDGAPYPFAHAGLGVIAYLLIAGSILAAPWLGADDRLGRRAYAALLLWAAPGAIAWLAYRRSFGVARPARPRPGRVARRRDRELRVRAVLVRARRGAPDGRAAPIDHLQRRPPHLLLPGARRLRVPADV
jgi:hypothetical protein